MSIRASVSAPTSCSFDWKKTRLPSADAPRNWLLIAPLPPFGPVDTTAVVLWVAPAVPQHANTIPMAAANAARLPVKFSPKEQPAEAGHLS
jgi:hypothetical protein